MAVHGAVLVSFYVLYWPVFYLIWSRDPRVGPEGALGQIMLVLNDTVTDGHRAN